MLIELIDSEENFYKFKDKAIIAGLNLSTAKSISRLYK